MGKFHELDNYIADVPMTFSKRYLSLQAKSNTLLEDSDDENFNRFKPEDYKFGAELIAIEVFELHHKKKQDQAAARAQEDLHKAVTVNANNHNALTMTTKQTDSAVASIPHSYHHPHHPAPAFQTNSLHTPPHHLHHTPPTSSRANQSIVNNSNNLFYNMIPGEILKPRPLNNANTSDSQPSVHSDCDKSNNNSSDTKLAPKLRQNFVNPREFENDDSSPFDNVELQTIDDIKELNNVFQALNNNSHQKPF